MKKIHIYLSCDVVVQREQKNNNKQLGKEKNVYIFVLLLGCIHLYV